MQTIFWNFKMITICAFDGTYFDDFELSNFPFDYQDLSFVTVTTVLKRFQMTLYIPEQLWTQSTTRPIEVIAWKKMYLNFDVSFQCLHHYYRFSIRTKYHTKCFDPRTSLDCYHYQTECYRKNLWNTNKTINTTTLVHKLPKTHKQCEKNPFTGGACTVA